MNCVKEYFRQPKEIYIIVFSTLINRIGGLVSPFLTAILANNIGVGSEMIGILVASFSIVTIIGSLIGGQIADRFSPRKLRYITQYIFGIMYVLIAFIEPSYLMIVCLLVAQFLFSISQPTRSMLILRHSPEENYKSAFSLVYVAINVAFSVGPLFAGLLYYQGDIFYLFMFDGLTSILSAYFITRLPEKELPLIEKTKTKEKDKLSVWVIFKNNVSVIMCLLVTMFYAIAFTQQQMTLTLQTTAIFKDDFAIVYAFIMSINGIMCMIMAPVLTIVLKKISSSFQISLNGILYVIGFGMYGLTTNRYLFYLATAIWTTGEVLGAINFDIYIAQHTPSQYQGRVLSLIGIMRRAGFIIGPIIAGFLISLVGFSYTWFIIILFPLLGAVIILLNQKRFL